MAYIILTEKSKTEKALSGDVFYSKVSGCFSRKDQATRFDSFEAAQPTVKELRKAAPQFYFYAIEVRLYAARTHS